MGWTSYPATHYTKSGAIDRKAECRKYLAWPERHELVADAMVGSTYYAAVRDLRDGSVFAIVALTSIEWGEFGIKEMDEDMGPCAYDCPARILDKLSPTDSEFANAWRERCRANAVKKAGFKALPTGARMMWRATWTCPGLFDEGESVKLEKRQQSSAKGSPYVWHVVGSRSCLRVRDVDFESLEPVA